MKTRQRSAGSPAFILRSAPTGRIRSETEPGASDLARKESNVDSVTGHVRPVENVGESKIINGLVGRIVSKLPCNSGMRIETLANDPTIVVSVQSLRQLATLRLSTVVNCLAGALEGLAKYSVSKSHTDVSLNVHQSQAYLLHLLDSCLTATWRQRAETTASQTSGIPRLWPDPPPLDETSARALLSVVTLYLRFVSTDDSPHTGTASPAPSRDGRGQSSAIVSWGHGTFEHPSFSALSSLFLRTHQYRPRSHEPSRYDVEPLSCTNLSNIVDSVTQTTRYLGQVIFYLSSSNWNLVFSRIRTRLAHLTTSIEDTPDLIELRLLQWLNLDRVRLGQLMQETSHVFMHIRRPSQIAFASVLHSAIWTWVDSHPEEFDSLVETESRLDGNAEAIFDTLYSMSDFSSSNAKRTAVFYPLLATILIICPDLFRKVVSGESVGKSAGLSKKFSFMESLKKGLSGHKGFEPSVACYVDFVEAATRVSPRHSTSALRTLLPQVLHDLKDGLFFGSHSNDLVDSGLPVDGLVAMYCADPVHIGSTVFNRLWLDSDISRATAVKACNTIVAEASSLPWLPSAVTLRQEAAGSVRQVFKAAVANFSADRGGLKRPRMSSEASPSLVDLLTDILKLYEQDPQFALASTGRGDTRVGDHVDQVVPLLSTLLVGSGPDSLKVQAGSALLAVLGQITTEVGKGIGSEISTSTMWPAIWQALTDTSRQVLFAFDSGDSEDLVLACNNHRQIVPAVSHLTKAAMLHPPTPGIESAVLVAAVATLLSLAGSAVEQQSSISPALAALSHLVQIAYEAAPQFGGESRNESRHQAGRSIGNLLDELSKLPHATGRQQQQRQIRRVLRTHAQPSIVMSAVWTGLNHRLKNLMGKMGRFSPETSSIDLGGSAKTLDTAALADAESKEWQNLNALLAATASCALDTAEKVSLGQMIGAGQLPQIYDEVVDIPAQVDTFIDNSVNMLSSGSIFIRESVKEALGNELPVSLGRTLVAKMMSLLVHCVGPNGISVSEPLTILVEQSIAVLRLISMDRVPVGTRLDLSEIMFYFARYLCRLGRDEAALRIKMRFCHLAELVLSKDETASTGQDMVLKNALLDWLTEWSVDTTKEHDSYSTSNGDRGRTQKDLDHACLRTLVVVTNGLVLRSTTETPEDTPIAVRARLFQKYLALLIKSLERASVTDDTSIRRRTTTAESQMGNLATEIPSTLAIAALSNLLSANMDVGLKHCLTLGYHEDPLLRSAFLQLTSSILRTATPFGGLVSQLTQSNQPTPFLDALVSENLAFAVAICEVCPVPEVDEMLALLFRSMEAKGTLMNLVKVMIEKEVAQTNHESELFRANSITTKMLTVFGKTFGYNYVRSTLQPLIHDMLDKPAACSFELDPTKAGPNEDIDKNADHLRLICQALLNMICTSTSKAPVMFRALCHQIWEIVEDRFPEARHSAIGSFIFLRFFCPAIVTPEAVDLDVPSESREIRRALLLITKVIQNLANNVKFKEPHMQLLNTFLAENIKQVTRFLSDIAMRPRSWELAQAMKQYADETEKSQDRDVDNEILHAFVYRHYSRLQPVLESMPPSYRRSITPRSARADIDGTAALRVIIDLMRITGEPVEAAALNTTVKVQAYDDLMRSHAGRDTSGLKSVFVEGPLSQNGRRIFYFIFSGLNLVDYDLLAYHIFKTMEGVTETFDIIFDFTGYTPAVDIPKYWIQRIAQLCPTRVLQLVNFLALYNVNTFATKRLRRIVGILAPICGSVGKQVITACSPSELGENIPFTNLGLPDFTMNLAFEADHVFTNLLKLSTHEAQMPVVVKLGLTCLQIASWSKFPVTSSLKAYIVDTIKLNEIDDLVTGSGDTEDHLVVTYRQTNSVTFVSKKRNEMAHLIRTARSRLRDTPSEERALRPRDVPGTLLNIALLNLSAADETLRTGAYNLFNDLGKFFDYDMFQGVRKVTAGMTLPANSLAFVFGLSQTLAKNAPYLTLEFLKEWTIGFSRADVAQKTACLQYVGPWISNLEAFASPSREDAEESCKQVAEIIRSLIAITGFERKRLQLVMQEHVWARLADKNEHVTDIVLTELIDAAMGGGLGSERAECVAEILHVISTTAIRGQLIARLRKTIAQTYLKPSAMLDQNPAWNEICVLARINLMLSFTPANPLGAQLFLPELIHIITLLVGIGPTLVRQTIYGLFINLLQSMASSKATDEMNATSLQHALEKAQTPWIMCCFGLVQLGNGLESLEERSNREEAENSRLDRVGTLANFMGEILVAAAPSPDCANAWRARWMGLVVGTCFQHNPATQPQAFTILGYLASDEVDDDLVYQVLVAMSTTLSHLSDTDTTLLTSMLRCLSRIIPGLQPDSRYATSLFWLAFAIAEMGYIPLFGPALELMHTALEALNGDEEIDRVMDHLFGFRHSMDEPARKIDQIAGISFEQEPSFGIIGILFKGFRHPSTRKAAIDVALELLRVTTQNTGPVPEDEGALISQSSVAYFVALLPVLAGDVDELKNLFIAAGLEVKDESLMDLSTLSVLSVLSIPDNSSAIFVVTIIVTILNSAPSDTERLILYRLLADASSEMPEVLSMAYDSLIPRLSTTINTSSHPALIHNATVVLSRALADPAYTFPSSGTLANDSQTSLQQSFKGSISSLNGGGNGGAMVAVLDDLGMKGLSEGGFTPVKMDRLAMMAKWVAALIDSFTL